MFLAGGFVFHALGLSMAYLALHRIDVLAACLLQIVITATQWMTHYANDYFDREGDALNQTPTAWSGGSRVLPEGRLSPRTALAAAIGWGLIAVMGISAIMVILRPGFLVLGMMILALGVGWFYSAPPIRLVGRGLGEIIGALTVPGLTTLLGFTLQTRRLDLFVIGAILPLVLMQFAMLLSVASPDEEADRASGKRTLVVLLGRDQAGRLYALALAAAYVTLLIYSGLFAGRTALIALLLMPFAVWQGWNAARGGWRDGSRQGMVAFWSIAIMIGTALIEAAVFVWLGLGRPLIL
jgi:1,4-dihydroxy-2-naphthoate polyprenyltransferase